MKVLVSMAALVSFWLGPMVGQEEGTGKRRKKQFPRSTSRSNAKTNRYLEGQKRRFESSLQRLEKSYGRLSDPDGQECLRKLRDMYAKAIEYVDSKIGTAQPGKRPDYSMYAKINLFSRRAGDMEKLLGLYRTKVYMQGFLKGASDDAKAADAKTALDLCEKMIVRKREILKLQFEQDASQEQLDDIRQRLVAEWRKQQLKRRGRRGAEEEKEPEEIEL